MARKRLRDPIHGLIAFDLNDEVDSIAWQLIGTPEFQRLRRVKQLGVSEFIFPGATHNRFAHSIGVFHVARNLMKSAKDLCKKADISWSHHKERVALLAALLHDLGHGPFSHAFEQAEKQRYSSNLVKYKSHEKWTSEIIRNQAGDIFRIISEHENSATVDEVADLLVRDPEDIYSAVVSSSFDADRLDFLRRDKYMTGSGAGGIDFHWLLDNLDIATDVSADDYGESDEPNEQRKIQTLCFKEKATQAAETFILARYHLYTQVYFHKTTRGIEKLLTAFLVEMAKSVKCKNLRDTGIWSKNPLVAFFRNNGDSVSNYLSLDDTVVWSAIRAAVKGKNQRLAMLADRLLNRRLMKVVTIETSEPTDTDRKRRQFIVENFASEIGLTVFEDRVPLSVYSVEEREQVKPHKRVRIKRSSDATSVDITKLSKAVASLTEKQELLRYYFLNESDWRVVSDITGENHAGLA